MNIPDKCMWCQEEFTKPFNYRNMQKIQRGGYMHITCYYQHKEMKSKILLTRIRLPSRTQTWHNKIRSQL